LESKSQNRRERSYQCPAAERPPPPRCVCDQSAGYACASIVRVVDANKGSIETKTTRTMTTSATSSTPLVSTTPLGVIEPFLRSSVFLEGEDDDDDDEVTTAIPSWSASSSAFAEVNDDVVVDDIKSCSVWPLSSSQGGGELYGRQDAAQELVQAFERCCSCAAATSSAPGAFDEDAASAAVGDDDDDDEFVSFELVLITGASGTGKTSLAKTILKPHVVLERGGFFISAKFEQFLTRSAPYYPMQQAFQELVQQVLLRDLRLGGDDECTTTTGTSTSTLLQEVQRIADPIVASEPLLLNMLPSLKDLVSASVFALNERDNGNHNKNVRSGPSAEHRLLQAFVRLLRALCSPERPLVLFLGK
jgi:AAA ATPase domain